MKRFRFRLERVKRVREVEEEVARARWQEALLLAHSAEEALVSMRTARQQAEQELGADLEVGALEPSQVLVRHAAIEDMERAAARMATRARTLALQADELRVPWEEKRLAVRGLERLRERRASEHRRDVARSEAAEMDEVASMRAARKDARPER